VYRRRRYLAIGGSVLAALLLVWLVGGLFADDEDPTPRPASAESTGIAGLTRPTSTQSSPPPMPSPVAQVPASSSSSAPAPAAPPPPPPPPAPPQACPDTALRLITETGAPQYKVGDHPVLRMVLTNAGTVACFKDVNRKFREVQVRALDGARLFSSTDCYPSDDPEVTLLQPGERLVFSVTWFGTTTAPGCPLKRNPVRAGTYQVVGRIGELISPPATFALI